MAMVSEAEWVRLSGALDLPKAISSAGWADIETGYAEPHRRYHTFSHLDTVLTTFKAHSAEFDDGPIAQLALFYHDLVYDPARSDNETRSAARLVDRFSGHISIDRLNRAAAHIDATRHHNQTDDADTNLLLDIDMAILGAPWVAYLEYARAVYAEYVPVYGAEAYAAGRIKLFIEPTLAKERLFLTEGFAGADQNARKNLAGELDLWLSGQFGAIAPL